MGLSFGEIVVIAVIALVVIGPKDLPKLMRSLGKMIGQAKRALSDVKRETGLDEILRGDFRDLERLADHIEELGNEKPRPALESNVAFRAREYPVIGADSALLLPEDADVYPEETPYAATVLGALPASASTAASSSSAHETSLREEKGAS